MYILIPSFNIFTLRRQILTYFTFIEFLEEKQGEWPELMYYSFKLILYNSRTKLTSGKQRKVPTNLEKFFWMIGQRSKIYVVINLLCQNPTTLSQGGGGGIIYNIII